jgi:HK97 gp10 family phage protein
VSGLNVTFSGWTQLEQRMKTLANSEATKVGQSANRAGAAALVKKLKATAPVGPTAEGAVQNRKRKSGAVVQEAHHKIKNWIKIKKTRASSSDTVQNSVHIAKGFHSNFMEFGSIHTPATHWMQNTIDASHQEIIDAMAKALDKGLIRRGA